MKEQSLWDHIWPVVLTCMLLFGGWIFLTAPLALVFLIDEAFSSIEYLQFVVYAAAVSVGATVLLFFPVAWVLERILRRRSKLWVIALPVSMLGLSAFGLIAAVMSSSDVLLAFGGWGGRLFVFSVVFSVYWAVLWCAKGLRLAGARLRSSSSQDPA